MASGPYLENLAHLVAADPGDTNPAAFQLGTDDLRWLLVHDNQEGSGGTSPNHPKNKRATAKFLSDLSLGTYEPSSHPGYARKELGEGIPQTVTKDAAAIEVEIDAPDLVYSGFEEFQIGGIGVPMVGAVLFRHTGADSTARCLFYYDFFAAGKQFNGTTGATITLAFPSEGFLKFRGA